MISQQKAKRKVKGKPKPNRLLINGHLPHALPVNVGLSIVAFLLVELTAEEKDFLISHMFPTLSPVCLLSFTEEMLVAKKDATDLVKENAYHDTVTQWEQNGKRGKRPESPTYRYHAFRTSTRQISTDEEILLFGGVKKLTIPQMIYLHLVHGAYDRLVQHTQSRHLDQRRTKGRKTCWDLIVEWFNTPSNLNEEQRAALTPHLPSSSPITPRARKRVSNSPASTPRKSKRARTDPTSISPSPQTSIVATSYMDSSSFHPTLHPHPHPSQPPPHQLYQDYPLSTTAASACKSWYDSQPNHRFESESQLHHDLENMYGLHGMNQREDQVEALRGRVSFTPPPPFQTPTTTPNIIPPTFTIPLPFIPAASLQASKAATATAAASLPSQSSINSDQFVDSLLSSSLPSSQGDDGDWNQHPDLDALKLPDLPLDDISYSSPFLSPSSPFPSPPLSPLPTLFPELDPFDASS